jgi:hypothetical protein
MMIYTSIRKAKQKLRPKKEREEYEAWLAKHNPKKQIKSSDQGFVYKLNTPPGRETQKYKSLDTGLVAPGAAPRKVYTGDKMIGIATLHKSNAVPVFNNMDAVDISNMRR